MFLKEYFQGIIEHRYILGSLIQRDLLAKYRRSKLGVAWSVLTPLGLAVILGAVYAILFGSSPQVMIPMIFSGINPWVFMSGTADMATMAFPGAEGYIKQSTVSTQIFPLRTTVTNLVTLLYSMIAFWCVYLFLAPDKFGPAMLLSIPGLLIMFLFTLGLANITSVINLYFRDFSPLQSLIFQGLFYATPIIFDPKMLADRGYALVYEVNPFFYMLEIVRRPMLGAVPELHYYPLAILITLISFFAGAYVQVRFCKKIVYML